MSKYISIAAIKAYGFLFRSTLSVWVTKILIRLLPNRIY